MVDASQFWNFLKEAMTAHVVSFWQCWQVTFYSLIYLILIIFIKYGLLNTLLGRVVLVLLISGY